MAKSAMELKPHLMSLLNIRHVILYINDIMRSFGGMLQKGRSEERPS